MRAAIMFPSPSDSALIKSLEGFGDRVLWRKTEQNVEHHFLLRLEKNEKEVSLFELKDEKVENTGVNFLRFFFCFPMRGPICREKNWIYSTRSVKFFPKELIKYVNSSPNLQKSVNLEEKIRNLQESKKQSYENATHCELSFFQDENGKYYDDDKDVKKYLSNCCCYEPSESEQSEKIDSLIKESKHTICKLLFKELMDILIIIDSDHQGSLNSKRKEKLEEDLKKVRKLIEDLLKNNYDLSSVFNKCFSDFKADNTNPNWSKNYILGKEGSLD